MAHTPAISVVVPVRDGEATIAACLRSILGGDYPAAAREVVVVDNGSTDGTAAIVRTFPVRAVAEPVSGPSAARNRGIAESRNDVIAFVDADCIATKGWLGELAAGFRRDGVTGVAGEIVSYPPATAAERFMASRHPRWQHYALHAVRPYAVTANVAFRREVFTRIGLFDRRMVRAQDLDFGWRFFSDRQMRMEYAPKALVLHRHRTSIRSFVRQQIGWGYGHALLHAKYGLPWTPRDELHQYGRLAGTVAALAATLARGVFGRTDRASVEFALFELLRCGASRLGATRGLIETRGSARFAPPSEASGTS
jgi:glycosyltransferase involved in cell wall biosynthesis